MTTTETIGCFHFYIKWSNKQNLGIDQHSNLWQIKDSKAEMVNKENEDRIINAIIDLNEELRKLKTGNDISDAHALILNDKLS